MKFLKYASALVFFLGALFLPISLLAAEGSPFVPRCVVESTCDDINIFVYLAISLGRYIFSFVGAVALLFFVYGGFVMITSRGNKENISRGTKAMTAAVIGLVVAFSGYALITFLAKSVGLRAEFQITQILSNKV